MMGIYPVESVSEVAQSLPLDPLASGSAEVLAGDVEYRIHLIIQEARKFMINGKRTTMTPEDIEYAMEALNVEPILIPPRPLPQQPFQPVSVPTPTGTQTLYHVPDDEIDFATYLKEPLPPGLANSAGVKWKAHWLAVEGVQPAIPENPAPSSRAGPSRHPLPATGNAALRPSAKSTLPQELQLYFSRLTTALIPAAPTIEPDTPGLPDTERHRQAALASLRSDSAVAGILVYIVKWLADSVQKCLVGSTSIIAGLLEGVEALIHNNSIFLEPYIHQLLGPVMSILLTFPLGPHPPPSGSVNPFELRARAADVLKRIAEVYGPKYPGLLPRLTSTLTKSLNSAPFPSPLGATIPPAGRYEGSLLGLAAIGPHAVRSAVWSPESLGRIDDLSSRLYPGSESKKGRSNLLKAFSKAMGVMVGPKPQNIPSVETEELAREFGYGIARGLEKRPWIASEMLRMRREEGGTPGMEVEPL